MTIRLATEADQKDIRELWQLVFTEDSESYLDFYFDVVMNKNKVIIIREDNELVGMLHLNPYELSHGVNIFYIVGVATHPNHRRKGIMRSMLDMAHQKALEEQRELILLPEDERFYTPFGYKFVSMQYNTTIDVKEYRSMLLKDNIDLKKLSKDVFIQWFNANTYEEKTYEVIHSDDYLSDLYDEMKCENGFVADIDGNLVLYYVDDVIEIRKIYYKFNGEELSDQVEANLQRLASKLVELADDKLLVIHEVNERCLSGVFSYSRKNNYDYRPYMMMKLTEDKDYDPIWFDEVV